MPPRPCAVYVDLDTAKPEDVECAMQNISKLGLHDAVRVAFGEPNEALTTALRRHGFRTVHDFDTPALHVMLVHVMEHVHRSDLAHVKDVVVVGDHDVHRATRRVVAEKGHAVYEVRWPVLQRTYF